VDETPAPRAGKSRRAHASSFFGARKARETKEPVAVEAVDQAVPAEAVAEVAETVEPVEVVAEVAETVEPVEVVEVVAEVTETVEPVEAVAEPVEVVTEVTEPVEAVAEPVEAVEFVTDDTETVEPVEAVAELNTLEPEEAELDVQVQEIVAEQVEADETRPASNLNDTPIFRAMMSRWLTDEPVPATDDAAWSPSEADAAWSAAARIEESQPYEESSAGLPKRRPGSFLIPGAIENVDAPEAAEAPAVNRRDPEAIRRRLNRHQQGVSSARTEAQDGNHREEADVHH